MKRDIECYQLDAFLSFNEYEVLTNAGSVSAAVAKRTAEEAFERFRVSQNLQYVSDFEKQVQQLAGSRKERRPKTSN